MDATRQSPMQNLTAREVSSATVEEVYKGQIFEQWESVLAVTHGQFQFVLTALHDVNFTVGPTGFMDKLPSSYNQWEVVSTKDLNLKKIAKFYLQIPDDKIPVFGARVRQLIENSKVEAEACTDFLSIFQFIQKCQ